MGQSMSDGSGIKTVNWFANEMVNSPDAVALSEVAYKNMSDHFEIASGATESADRVLRGLRLTPLAGMGCTLQMGVALGLGGRYFDASGNWGYIADASGHYASVVPVDTTVAFAVGGGSTRIDILEIRPTRVPSIDAVRDFRDPSTLVITPTTIKSKIYFGFEYLIKTGTATAPLTDAGWIKIAEITVAAGATSLLAADILDIRSAHLWTQETARTIMGASPLKINWGVDDFTKESALNIPLGSDLSDITPTGGTTSALTKTSTVWSAIQALFTRLIDLSGVQSSAVLTRHLNAKAVTSAKLDDNLSISGTFGAGGKISGVGMDAGSQKINNVQDPSAAQDAATKAFASNASNLSAGIAPMDRLPFTVVQIAEHGNFNLPTFPVGTFCHFCIIPDAASGLNIFTPTTGSYNVYGFSSQATNIYNVHKLAQAANTNIGSTLSYNTDQAYLTLFRIS